MILFLFAIRDIFRYESGVYNGLFIGQYILTFFLFSLIFHIHQVFLTKSSNFYTSISENQFPYRRQDIAHPSGDSPVLSQSIRCIPTVSWLQILTMVRPQIDTQSLP